MNKFLTILLALLILPSCTGDSSPRNQILTKDTYGCITVDIYKSMVSYENSDNEEKFKQRMRNELMIGRCMTFSKGEEITITKTEKSKYNDTEWSEIKRADSKILFWLDTEELNQ